MQIYDVFPIPLCVTTLGESARELNKTLISDLKQEIEKETIKRSGVNVKQTQTKLDKKYESYKLLSSKIDQHCYAFIKNICPNITNVKSSAYFGNINDDETAFHMPHSHSFDGFTFTGVYYPSSGIRNDFNISDNENLDEPVSLISSTQPPDGALVILDPLEYVKTGLAPEDSPKYPYFGNPICVIPKESALVIFPSYLPHMVSPTREKGFTRISIAFNITVGEMR
jgi:hypothetical protein